MVACLHIPQTHLAVYRCDTNLKVGKKENKKEKVSKAQVLNDMIGVCWKVCLRQSCDLSFTREQQLVDSRAQEGAVITKK